MVGDSNDASIFPYKLLLTSTQVSRPYKSFTNGASADMKFSKTKLSQMIQFGKFFGIGEAMLRTQTE